MSVTSAAVCSVSSQPNQKKSPKPARAGSCPALIRCALTTIPDCWACRKILVSRTTGSDPAASRSRSTSPAPTEGSWSTSPTSSRCAPGATALMSLLARITSTIEVSSTTTRSASSGFVGVEGRLTARAQRQQPVDGGRLVPGQLGEPLGRPAGRRGEHDPGSLGPGQLHHRAHGVGLPAAGTAGQHRDLRGQGQPDRVGLFRARARRRSARAASPAPCPSPRPRTRSAGQPARQAGGAGREPRTVRPDRRAAGRRRGPAVRPAPGRAAPTRAPPRGPPLRPRPARPGTG